MKIITCVSYCVCERERECMRQVCVYWECVWCECVWVWKRGREVGVKKRFFMKKIHTLPNYNCLGVINVVCLRPLMFGLCMHRRRLRCFGAAGWDVGRADPEHFLIISEDCAVITQHDYMNFTLRLLISQCQKLLLPVRSPGWGTRRRKRRIWNEKKPCELTMNWLKRLWIRSSLCSAV